MIRHPFYDSKCTVYLLQEEQSAHLVREGHARKGKPEVCLFGNLRRDAFYATDDKNKMLLLLLPAQEEIGKLPG